MATPCHSCRHPSRRAFLADLGLGFTGLALGAMLQRDGFANPAAAWSPPDGKPHFPPKAKHLIFVFLTGGFSHVDTFDPKPKLKTDHGKTVPGRDLRETGRRRVRLPSQ